MVVVQVIQIEMITSSVTKLTPLFLNIGCQVSLSPLFYIIFNTVCFHWFQEQDLSLTLNLEDHQRKDKVNAW